MLLRLAATGILTSFALAGGVAAQTLPSKPIRVINPFGVGSATDVIPRIILEQMQANIGQPVLLESRPGAGSMTGTAQVVAADPDGTTLLVNSSAHTLVPAMYKNVSFDTAKDLAGVAMLGVMPQVIITSPAKGFKTIQEFVADAKSKPGTYNFTSLGVGSATHISAEKLRLAADFKATHVPFKSGAEALSEIVAGRMDFYLCPIGTALPFIQEKRVVGLAVSTPKRALALPDLPTTVEAGYPNSQYVFWFGVFAPSKTPKTVIDQLHLEFTKALTNPSVSARLLKLGVEPMPMKPAELDAYVQKEVKDNIELIKVLGIKAG